MEGSVLKNSNDLLEILKAQGILHARELKILRADSMAADKRVEDLLRENLSISEEAISRAISERLRLPYIEVGKQDVDMRLLERFKASILVNWQILPFRETPDEIYIVFAAPSFELRIEVEKFVVKQFGKKVKAFCGNRSETIRKIRVLNDELTYDKAVRRFINEALQEEKRAAFGSPAIPNLLDALINACIAKQVTDMHFIHDGSMFRLFVRQDGSFFHYCSFPPELSHKMLSALKQRAEMDAGDQVHVQDGHFTHTVDSGRIVNFRVSAIPLCNNGESLALRVLDSERIAFNLDKLGFFTSHLRSLKQLLRKPQGLILVTGPTGSGKTTTLYSIINELNPFERSVLTIEDPVEYHLPFVRQVQVNERAERVPGKILRSFLRHDPDIILVGEIRDTETAEVALQAAGTGHLVLSTLHTNNAPSALMRLRDLGVSDISMCSSLRLVMSQRLVKRICPECRREVKLTKFEKDYVRQGRVDQKGPFFRGEGCNACSGSGYRGVDIVYEILAIDEYDFEKIKVAKTTKDVFEFARAKGYLPMRDIGLQKARQGITTVKQVIRACG